MLGPFSSPDENDGSVSLMVWVGEPESSGAEPSDGGTDIGPIGGRSPKSIGLTVVLETSAGAIQLVRTGPHCHHEPQGLWVYR